MKNVAKKQTNGTTKHKASVEAETRDMRPASMRGMPAIEGFAEEATEAMGKLALAFAQLVAAGDILDDELSVEIQQAIGVVALDLRLIHDEAVAAGDREVPS